MTLAGKRAALNNSSGSTSVLKWLYSVTWNVALSLLSWLLSGHFNLSTRAVGLVALSVDGGATCSVHQHVVHRLPFKSHKTGRDN